MKTARSLALGLTFALTVAACSIACSSADDGVESPGGDGGPTSSNDSDALAPNGDVFDAGANGDGASTTEGGTKPNDAKPLDLSAVPQKKFTYFPIEGAFCRDGSPAGFGMSPVAGSKKIMVYLQGGGGCYNSVTCAENPSKVSSKSASAGIFERGNAANPVADWNHVFVPYCTGDVHVGNNPNGSVPGVGPQKFVGYVNTALFLQTLAATFKDATHVLLTGSSAGGIGAAGNYGQAVREFPNARVNLVDDSGPSLRSPALATCLQAAWRDLWALDKTVIADCGTDCQGQDDFAIAASKHSAKANPNFAQGLISTTGDGVIRQMFGFGEADCTAHKTLSVDAYSAGLLDFRSQHAPYANYGVFAQSGTSHTFVEKPVFYTSNIGGKTIAEWVADIVNQNKVSNLGPP